MKHFHRAILEVDEANDQVQLMVFQAGLTTKDFIFSLARPHYNDRPLVQSPEVHERKGRINGKWDRWQAKDGRNRSNTKIRRERMVPPIKRMTKKVRRPILDRQVF